MSLKQWRIHDDIHIDTYSSIDLNFDKFINSEIIPTLYNDNILIWLDRCIHNYDQDDRYSFYQLYCVIKSIFIFTNEEECLKFIKKFETNKNKLFLIVSGSVGQNFVPNINHLSQINSIYIFCGRKNRHEDWVKNYKKIKGVFDDIKDLCINLEYNTRKFELNTVEIENLIKLLPKKSSSPYKFDEIICFSNSYCDIYQPQDDIQISTTSIEIPFSNKENCSSKNEIEVNNNVTSSQTVTPFTQYKQQMEFSDTGIWPSLSVIDSEQNGIFNHLHSVVGTVKYFQSIENCLQYVCDNREDPHLIVICDLTKIEYLPILIRTHVRNIYIYCPNKSLNEYCIWSEKYPNIVSVLQHIDTLTRLILWDLSACIVNIGNYYDNENQKNLAQTRYRYAYRLHIIIHEDLNNRLQMFERVDQ
ncbi:unnamed protein product [Rotaria sp. Silwood1]|nr:unnamed protein product [Rotaria sp. Silwood1]CAF3480294.1 unnamed protein product [Rotaria sp. Silwood1]CAF4630638.1 unnamed protein product [Rotaria sp. Silwood1]